MRDIPMSVLAVFAHPDDEISVGATLAHLEQRGVLVTLACASRGEAATIYCDGCATRQNLADVRTHELECASRLLGVSELRWLDWPDGAIRNVPRARAVHQLVALIREFMPDVVITHPEHGLYPHPDHLAVRELVREAFAAAADPRQLTGAGKAWPVARLFAPVIPQSFFDAEPVFGEQRVELGGQRLAFAPTPDDQVAVIMRTAGTADRRMAAWECHRSQHNPNGAFAHLPENRRRWLAENEHFVLDLDRAHVATDGGNLLAGLEGWPGGGDADSGLPAVLRGCLSARQAYLEIYYQYAAAEPKPQFRALLHSLAEREQEFLYVLAGALRQMDEIPGSIGKDERLQARARGCRTARSQSQFLLTAARHAVLRYMELASMPGDDSSGALWEQLQHLAEENVGAITEYILLEQGLA